jgi:hypothetical protein
MSENIYPSREVINEGAVSAVLHWVRTTEVFQTTVGTILRYIHLNILTFLSGRETCQCRSLEPYARKNKKRKK